MNEIEQFEEKLSPKEELEMFAALFAFIGIVTLTAWGLHYLISSTILGESLIYIFSTIGSILENTLGNIPRIGQIAVFFLMMAGILGFGSLLKDEDDIIKYIILVVELWFIALIALIGLGVYSAFVSIPISAVIGISFILFISPPIIFAIIKGISALYKRIQQ